MVISDTLLRNERGTERQVTMPARTYKTLKAAKISKKFSPGVLVSEILMMANPEEYGTDAIARIEQDVVGQLADEVGANPSKVWKAIHSTPTTLAHSRSIMASHCEKNKDPDESYNSVSIWMMEEVVDALPNRGAAEPITKAIQYAIASPWESRTERIDDLRDLRKYAQGQDVEDKSSFVSSVIVGESDTYDVDDLHSLVADVDKEWYESQHLDLGTLKKRGNEIPQTGVKRSPALETALSNDEKRYSPDEIRETAEDVYPGIQSNRTIEGYVDGVDIQTVNDGISGFQIEFESKMNELAEQTIKAIPSSKTETMRSLQDFSNAEIAGFETSDLDNIDYNNYVYGEFAGVEAITNLKRELKINDKNDVADGVPTIRVENANKMADYLEEILAEMREHFET